MIKTLRNHFIVFKNRIEDIEKYIDLLEKQKEIIQEIQHKKDDGLSKTREYVEMLIKYKNQVINYNAIIISLYGSYENFINDILDEYLKAIIKLDVKYESLDKSIKEKYLKEATEYLSNPQRFVNYGLEIGDIVESLHECIKNNNCTNINTDLILKHPANLKIAQINDLFNNVGIKNCIALIKKSYRYIEYYKNEKGIDNFELAKKLLLKEQSNDIIFATLQELVDRRNSVAHGWNTDDRIGLKDIKDIYIKYMNMICECFFDIICTSYMEKLYEKGQLKKFDKVIAIYNHYILCINGQNVELKVGDYLFIKKNNNNNMVAEIYNIKANGNSVKEIKTNDDIGLKLSVRVKESDEFYYI